MKPFFTLITAFALCFSSGYSSEAKSYLLGRIPENNHRYETFIEALNLCTERNAKVLVETGTSRQGKTSQGFWWDGGATIIFTDWARDHDAEFYSVDIDQEALNGAAKGLDYNLKNVHLVCRDSVKFLKDFGKQIDFLYLDSYDFDANNPGPSQEHHLKEIIAVYPRLTDKTIILIDDCGLSLGGKGKLVIPYLEELGWKIHKCGYQVLMLKS